MMWRSDTDAGRIGAPKALIATWFLPLAWAGMPKTSFRKNSGALVTSNAFTDVLKQHDIRISMDGKGRWIDNVFIERLWRSVKYEEVYLHAYESLTQARNGLEKYFEFYNTKRKHQTLKAKPNEVYYKNLPTLQKAA